MSKEKLLEKIHIKWLSKAKTAIINGDEMTVLPYGYLTQACSEVIDQTREETIRDVEEMIGDFNWYSAPQDLLVTFGLDKEGTRHKLRAENLKQSLNKLKK